MVNILEKTVVVIVLLLIISSSGYTNDVNVLDFGAKGDSLTNNTEYIQRSIDECAKTGGGKVIIPPGYYLTGTILLRSNITLHLQAGSVLSASTNLKDYPVHRYYEQARKQIHSYKCLIYADSLDGIAITGNGTIKGNGFHSSFNSRKESGGHSMDNRPFIIFFRNCKNVVIRDLHFKNSASWMLRYENCDFVNISGITVFNHCNRNNDGLDIVSCSNVAVTNCFFDTDDDAIVIKSFSRLSKNITISNCIISSHAEAIKCGTESNIGFKNIAISNCVVRPSVVKSNFNGIGGGMGRGGLSLVMYDGGTMENIRFSNIVMDSVRTPIIITLAKRGTPVWSQEPKQPGIGIIRNIHFNGITATNVGNKSCLINGLPGHDVTQISFRDMHFIFGNNIVNDTLPSEFPINYSYYPLLRKYNTPSFAFYLRNVSHIQFDGIYLSYPSSEQRPAIIVDEGKEIHINSLQVQMDKILCAPLVKLIQTKKVSITGVKGLQNINTFLEVNGNQSEEIIMRNNTFTDVKEIFINSDDVKPSTILMSDELR